MAMHKMSVFRWHLVDDQGWRIEIAGYPLLTQKGAWREGTGQESWDYFVGPAVEGKSRYGGFYTRDDGIHGGQLIQGSIALATGRHPIRVTTFENKFGEMLKVGYEGPGIGRQEIPDSVLTH
jgi:hypothetical protein